MKKVDLYELISALSISIDIAESTISNDKNFNEDNFYNAPSIAQHRFFNHSSRTCYVALKVAKEISNDASFLEDVYISSILHDIGVCCELKKMS